tara:strand:+ start:1350 stop:3317 length:1968 start_codon:yes stop_codon:yes gene_type:complete
VAARNRRELGLPPVSAKLREQQRRNARYRDTVTDKQLNAPAYQKSGRNKLIEAANVLAYFQNEAKSSSGQPLTREGRPKLSQSELINLVVDKKAARQAIKEGRITVEERNALMRQAGRQLQQFDNDQVGIPQSGQSRSRLVSDEELDLLDSQGQGRDQSELMDGVYKKSGKEANNAASYNQERYMTDELSKPDIQGGGDYINVAIAPASATRGTTAQQITSAALADKAVRDERAAMQAEVKALIKADAEKQPALGKFAQILNSSSASKRQQMIDEVKGMMPPDQDYINRPGQAVQLTGPDGGVVGYADEALNRFLGNIEQVEASVPAQARLTYPDQQRMTEDQFRAAYGNMDAQTFVDIYSAQSQPGNFQDTTLHTTNFVNKLKEQGLGSIVGNMGNVRSVGEVDVLLNRIRSELEAGADLGNFFLAKPSTTKTSRTQMYTEPENIGMEELTGRLGYETPEKAGLAMALQQMEMARMTRVNQQAKDAYMSRQAIQGPVRPGFYQGAAASMDDFAKSGLEYQRSTNSDLNNMLKAQLNTDKAIGALASDPRNMNRMDTLSGRVYRGRGRDEIFQNTVNNEIKNRGKAIREGQPDRGRAKFEAAMDRAELSAMESEFTQGRADETNRVLAERMGRQIQNIPPSMLRTNRQRPSRSEY